MVVVIVAQIGSKSHCLWNAGPNFVRIESCRESVRDSQCFFVLRAATLEYLSSSKLCCNHFPPPVPFPPVKSAVARTSLFSQTTVLTPTEQHKTSRVGNQVDLVSTALVLVVCSDQARKKVGVQRKDRLKQRQKRTGGTTNTSSTNTHGRRLVPIFFFGETRSIRGVWSKVYASPSVETLEEGATYLRVNQNKSD